MRFSYPYIFSRNFRPMSIIFYFFLAFILSPVFSRQTRKLYDPLFMVIIRVSWFFQVKDADFQTHLVGQRVQTGSPGQR